MENGKSRVERRERERVVAKEERASHTRKSAAEENKQLRAKMEKNGIKRRKREYARERKKKGENTQSQTERQEEEMPGVVRK